MGLKCRVACWLHVIGAVSMLGTGAAPAVAQTVGIRAGVSVNPELNLTHREANTSAEPGANVFVGVAHEDGLFAEIKIGALDSPRVKVGFGYAVRWR